MRTGPSPRHIPSSSHISTKLLFSLSHPADWSRPCSRPVRAGTTHGQELRVHGFLDITNHPRSPATALSYSAAWLGRLGVFEIVCPDMMDPLRQRFMPAIGDVMAELRRRCGRMRPHFCRQTPFPTSPQLQVRSKVKRRAARGPGGTIQTVTHKSPHRLWQFCRDLAIKSWRLA